MEEDGAFHERQQAGQILASFRYRHGSRTDNPAMLIDDFMEEGRRQTPIQKKT